MSRRLQKRGSRSEDVTQRKLDLDPRTQRQVSVEEQSLESRKRANAKQKKTYTNWISVRILIKGGVALTCNRASLDLSVLNFC